LNVETEGKHRTISEERTFHHYAEL